MKRENRFPKLKDLSRWDLKYEGDDRMKVAVVYDLPMSEEDKRMVEAVIRALSKKHDSQPLPIDEKFMETVKEYDFAFNLSTGGGKLSKQVHAPAILDRLGVPFTGSSAIVHAICIDKSITKLILEKSGIPTPRFVKIDDPNNIPEIDFYPAFVKPSCEGSALGISRDSVVKNQKELKKQVEMIMNKFNQPAIVEEFIDGREFTVGIIGNGNDLKVLPILEIDFSNLPEGLEHFYSHRVKHHYGEKTTYICPARLEESQRKKLENYAKRAFKAIGLFDFARIDVRMRVNEFYIIEVNSLPLLVPVYSDLTKMLAPIGWKYEDLVNAILEAAIARYQKSSENSKLNLG